MPAILFLILIVAAVGQFEPLIYESFESKTSGYSASTTMLARTCVYFSGYTVVSRKLEGEYLFVCPHRRGAISTAGPELVDGIRK